MLKTVLEKKITQLVYSLTPSINVCIGCQVCGVCKTCGCHGGKAEGVLHDRWQRGQNTGTSGTLHRSSQEQRCGGMQIMWLSWLNTIFIFFILDTIVLLGKKNNQNVGWFKNHCTPVKTHIYFSGGHMTFSVVWDYKHAL